MTLHIDFWQNQDNNKLFNTILPLGTDFHLKLDFMCTIHRMAIALTIASEALVMEKVYRFIIAPIFHIYHHQSGHLEPTISFTRQILSGLLAKSQDPRTAMDRPMPFVNEHEDSPPLSTWLIEKARREVEPLERGEVLNGHLNYAEYVQRRATFLGNLEEFRWRGARIFENARRSANQVYDSDESQALSVQEVRRREEKFEEFPLLPLPTKANTQTLNDFEDYPNREWEPPQTPQAQVGTASPVQARSSTTVEFTSNDTVVTPGQEPDPDLDTDQQHQPSSGESPVLKERTTESTSKQGTTPQSQAPGSAVDFQAVNGNITLPSKSPSTSVDVAAPQSLTSQPPTIQVDLGQLQSAPQSKTSQHLAADVLLIPQSPQTVSERDTASLESRSLSKPQAEGLALPSGVSALKDRGMCIPVKPQPGTKRSRQALLGGEEEQEEEKEALSATEQGDVDFRPPEKKQKRNSERGVKKPLKSTAKPNGSPALPRKRKQQIDEDDEYQDRKSAISLPAKKKQRVSLLEDVINGRELPLDVKQAEAASAERKRRLLNDHIAQQPKGTARKTGVKHEPELMPEFFNVHRFPKKQRDETVRCMCGATTDNGSAMVCCDECGVWEHLACVKSAAPQNIQDGAEDAYSCRVCDPWSHRAQLRKLRAGEPLN